MNYEPPSNEFVVTINMPAVQQKQHNLGADYLTNFSPTFKNTITRHTPPLMG